MYGFPGRPAEDRFFSPLPCGETARRGYSVRIGSGGARLGKPETRPVVGIRGHRRRLKRDPREAGWGRRVIRRAQQAAGDEPLTRKAACVSTATESWAGSTDPTLDTSRAPSGCSTSLALERIAVAPKDEHLGLMEPTMAATGDGILEDLRPGGGGLVWGSRRTRSFVAR
jgi:hypothetical protein